MLHSNTLSQKKRKFFLWDFKMEVRPFYCILEEDTY
jgi:hypothetical protein